MQLFWVYDNDEVQPEIQPSQISIYLKCEKNDVEINQKDQVITTTKFNGPTCYIKITCPQGWMMDNYLWFP